MSAARTGCATTMQRRLLSPVRAIVRAPRSTLSAAVLAALAAAQVHAQTQDAATTTTAALPPVLVTGNPLRSEDPISPSTVLSGDGLVLRRGTTLGDTLGGLPGVSSTYFGPNANRPVIRGQDGDRIRVLHNSGASLDASALSFDHAVPIDPLAVERMEVLRGPAALLYGGSAVGGVVNTIDNRIPRSAIAETGGAAELRLGGPARERGASALLETGGAIGGASGGSGFALHADAFDRRTDNLRVPAFDRPLDGGGSERRTEIVNSASDSRGGAAGGSWVWQHGYLGASVDTYRSDYGVVVEDDVTIRMQRDRAAVAGEVRDLDGFIHTLRGQVASTRYKHEEVEGTGEIGTTFNNDGEDFRVEAVHRPLAVGGGRLHGVFGAQGENARFDALGEEAFVPATRSRQQALFVMEEWSPGEDLRVSAGARTERARIRSQGDAPDAVEARFGPAQSRSFSPDSLSLGGTLGLAPQWQLTGNLSKTERAPTSYELFANGVHVATAAFERGNVDQQLERGTHADLGLQWKQDHHLVKLSLFRSRFSNYIALVDTGEVFTDGDESFPVYAFEGVRARLQGLELEGRTRVLDGALKLDLSAQLDSVRGDDLTGGQPLPRIAPRRTTLAVDASTGPWLLRADLQHAAEQTRVSADDLPTPSSTLLNASAAYRASLGPAQALWFVRLTNLTDELAFNAASIRTVRELAPLPGRGVMVGVRADL
jgi:iron complex outermembrane receptor protein